MLVKLDLSDRNKVILQGFASLVVLFALVSAYRATPGLLESLDTISAHGDKRLSELPTWPAVGLSLLALVPGVFLFLNLRHQPILMQT